MTKMFTDSPTPKKSHGGSCRSACYGSSHVLMTSALTRYCLLCANIIYWWHTHPWHELHKDGQLPLVRVAQGAVILDDALVTEILQKLDFAFKCVHFLHRSERIRRWVLPKYHFSQNMFSVWAFCTGGTRQRRIKCKRHIAVHCQISCHDCFYIGCS